MKRLIVCCDGTANDPDQMDRDRIAPTNVVKLSRALKQASDGGEEQLVYYDQGVGTGWWAKKAVEGLSGAGISQNIKEAYRFLASKYNQGDEIYCFGFSRGAFTVRSLCGFIHTCGLLNLKGEEEDGDLLVDKIYDLYRSTRPDEDKEEIRNCYKKDCHTGPVKIKFLGVWDTVGALGIPIGNISFEWNKHHNISNFKETVENAYHAVALDEFRRAFKPDLLDPSNVENTLVQKWFSGSHSNIGGGYADEGLSDITLKRMIDHLKGNFGLEFNEQFIKNNNNINPSYFRELRNSRTGFYKLAKPYLRLNNKKKIGSEDLDESVLHRMLDPTTGYAPQNTDTGMEKKKVKEVSKKKAAKKIYKGASKETDELQQKYYQKQTGQPDRFPLYLANGTVVGLLLWLLGSLYLIFGKSPLALSWEEWVSLFTSIKTFVIYVVLIPSGILFSLLVLVIFGFTMVSSIFKRRLKKEMKQKNYAAKTVSYK